MILLNSRQVKSINHLIGKPQSSRRQLIDGLGQIAIAALASPFSTQAIIAFSRVGAPLYYLPIIKVITFNIVLVTWISGTNDIIDIMPKYAMLPLRLASAAVGLAWITEGFLNAPEFIREVLAILL
jgi:hypothetical protein